MRLHALNSEKNTHRTIWFKEWYMLAMHSYALGAPGVWSVPATQPCCSGQQYIQDKHMCEQQTLRVLL